MSESFKLLGKRRKCFKNFNFRNFNLFIKDSKDKKASQFNIQFLMAFVAFIILIVSMVYFVINQMPKVEGLLKEKLFYTKQQSIKQKIFSYYGIPPNWNETLQNISVLGFSVEPFVLDYTKIYLNKLLIKNKRSLDKFMKLFEENVNGKKIQTYWLGYYKIKSLDPYSFFPPYGYLKIKREKWGLNISYNFTGLKNPYVYLELLILGELEEVNATEGTFTKATEIDDKLYSIKFDNKGTLRGNLLIYYYKRQLDYGVEYVPPTIIIIKQLECKPLTICEKSGFIEGNKKIPLMDYFGMFWYKNIIDKYQAVEDIELSLLKTFFSSYIVEVHYFVWTSEINPYY